MYIPAIILIVTYGLTLEDTIRFTSGGRASHGHGERTISAIQFHQSGARTAASDSYPGPWTNENESAASVGIRAAAHIETGLQDVAEGKKQATEHLV